MIGFINVNRIFAFFKRGVCGFLMKYRDTDYVFASALIRALENSLINYEKLSRMAQAPTLNDALRVLSECGYPEVSSGIDTCINAMRRQVFQTVEKACPAGDFTEFFRIRYYCNNIKAAVKGLYCAKSYDNLLTDVGGIDNADIIRFIKGENTDGQDQKLPLWMRKSIEDAIGKLAESGHAAEADLIIEQAGFSAMLDIAKRTASTFLLDYCRLLIDTTNIKAAARLAIMGKNSAQHITPFIIHGGSVGLSDLADGQNARDFIKLYENTALAEAADAAIAVISSNAKFSEITRASERAQLSFLAQVKNITFGEQPIIAYIAMREIEFIAVHAIISCLDAGLPVDSVMERLRWSYV